MATKPNDTDRQGKSWENHGKIIEHVWIVPHHSHNTTNLLASTQYHFNSTCRSCRAAQTQWSQGPSSTCSATQRDLLHVKVAAWSNLADPIWQGKKSFNIYITWADSFVIVALRQATFPHFGCVEELRQWLPFYIFAPAEFIATSVLLDTELLLTSVDIFTSQKQQSVWAQQLESTKALVLPAISMIRLGTTPSKPSAAFCRKSATRMVYATPQLANYECRDVKRYEEIV